MHASTRNGCATSGRAGAELIVTFNLQDFPAEALRPHGLVAQHPDDFVTDLLDQQPARTLEAAARHRRSLRHPPKTAEEYLDTLRAQGLTQTVAVLRRWTFAL
ncbi:hypothetical protein Tfont_01261 [Tepidimonas fonticaldi]|uniref:VapC50 C-terminal domain-containing protein n=1 Tax=Tepidimonas fonticaldi TaxID=1101373 RepID=A0A554XMW0_9BURK|nr:hypothetical protein Tfont_01261 [Tepidimonas fonticaldi]